MFVPAACFMRYVWNPESHEDMLFCEPVIRSPSSPKTEEHSCQNLYDNLRDVLNTSVKIVNFDKSKPLRSSLFEKLREEMGSNNHSFFCTRKDVGYRG